MWWEPPAPYPNIFVDDSGLNLVWTPGQLTQDTSISTASLAGSHYLGWHYGYFEVRMRWDTVTGAWPAIWMIPIEGVRGHRSSVETGELDIFEGAGHNPEVFYGTIHDWMNDVDLANNNCCNQYPLPAGTDLSQYHTYGVLWTPGRVTWYLDNQALNSIATYPIFDDCTQKYYLILGSQTFDPSAAPPSIRMQVNWVRVWQDERNACSAEGAGDELRSGR